MNELFTINWRKKKEKKIQKVFHKAFLFLCKIGIGKKEKAYFISLSGLLSNVTNSTSLVLSLADSISLNLSQALSIVFPTISTLPWTGTVSEPSAFSVVEQVLKSKCYKFIYPKLFFVFQSWFINLKMFFFIWENYFEMAIIFLH